MNKKVVFNSTKMGLSALVLIIAIMTSAVMSFAWFASYWQSGSNPFVAGDTPMPNFIMWEATDGENDTTTWNQIENKDGIKYKINPVSITSESGGTQYQIDLTSLHFGTVDNVVQLKPSNYVYMRYDLVAETHGKTKIDIEFSFADTTGMTYPDGTAMAYPFTVYGSNTNADGSTYHTLVKDNGTDITVNSAINTLNTSTPLIEYGYYLTATAPSSSETPANFSADATSSFDSTNKSFGTVASITTDIPEEGNYYLYIRLKPSVTHVAEMARILNVYMPSAVLFDLSLSINVF